MRNGTQNLSHWADDANIVVGLFLIAAPWIAGYSDHPIPLAICTLSGVLIVLMSIGAILRFSTWEEWVSMAVGINLTISPWMFGYSLLAPALICQVLAGLAVIILSGLELELEFDADATELTPH